MRILTPEGTLLGAMMHRNTTTKVRRQSPQKRVLAAIVTATEAVTTTAATTTTTTDPQSNVDKVRRIHLLGERNSGTNFLDEALVAAFPGYGAGKDKQYFQGGIPVFEYKHMFLHDPLNETQVQELAQALSESLFLLMVRNPCDWAVAMKKKPWHLCRPEGTECDRKGTNENAFLNYSLSEFWLEPVRDHGELSTPNASQPNEGMYGSTLQIRAHKLRLMRQVRDVVNPLSRFRGRTASGCGRTRGRIRPAPVQKLPRTATEPPPAPTTMSVRIRPRGADGECGLGDGVPI